jgi:hypothetical protein
MIMTNRRDTLSSLTSASDLSRATRNLSDAIVLLEILSVDHIRGSDREQVQKFIDLCDHWHMLARDMLEQRTEAQAPGKA